MYLIKCWELFYIILILISLAASVLDPSMGTGGMVGRGGGYFVRPFPSLVFFIYFYLLLFYLRMKVSSKDL